MIATPLDVELVKIALSVLTLVATATVFVAGLLQYRKAQRWKAAEFLAQQMKDFDANPAVQTLKRHLDIDGLPFSVPSLRPGGAEREIVMDHARLAAGLRLHTVGRDGSDVPADCALTDEETAIRATFDAFFDGTERLGTYEKTGLIRIDDLKPYLAYSFWILNDDRLRGAVGAYLGFYRYVQTLRLLRLFEADARRFEAERASEQARIESQVRLDRKRLL